MKFPVIILLVCVLEMKTEDFFFENGMHFRLPDDEIENLPPKRVDVNFTVAYSYPFKNIYDLVEENIRTDFSLDTKFTRHNSKSKIYYVEDNKIGLGKEEQYFKNNPTIKVRTTYGFLSDELRTQIILKTPDSPENVYLKTCSRGIDILQYQKNLSIIVMGDNRAEITDRTFICGKLQRTVVRMEHLHEFDVKSNLSFRILDYEMNHPMRHLIINNSLTVKIDARNLNNIPYHSRSYFKQDYRDEIEKGPVNFNIPLDYVDEIVKSDSEKNSNLGRYTNENEKNNTNSDVMQIESYNVFWFPGETVETDDDAEYEQSGSGDYASGSGNSDIIEGTYDTIDEDKHVEDDYEVEKMLLEDLLQPYNHKNIAEGVESSADGSGSGSGDLFLETDSLFIESSGLIDVTKLVEKADRVSNEILRQEINKNN